MKPKNINDKSFKLKLSDYEYDYQKVLTNKLDKTKASFNQNIINEIVLWKVNRYACIQTQTFKLINKIKPSDRVLNVDLTKEILSILLDVHGIQLPMASTILRFRNKYLYQIIDQRVYRCIYPTNLKLSSNKNKQIDMYIKYLEHLHVISKTKKIKFEELDRILYNADKRINSKIPLNNYGTKNKKIKQ
jgi:thermostable 8-oxoguanine DNA glycosylase